MKKPPRDRDQAKKPAQLLVFAGVVVVAILLCLGFGRNPADGSMAWSTPIEAIVLSGSIMLMGSVAALAGRIWRGILAVAALSTIGGLGAFLTHDNVPAGLLGWLVGSFLVTRYTVTLFHWGFRFLAAVVYGAVVGGVALYLWENNEGFLRFLYGGGAGVAGLAAAFLLVAQIQRPNREEAHYGVKTLLRFVNQAALMLLVSAGGALSCAQPVWVNWKSDDLPKPQEISSKISEIDVGDAAKMSLRVRKMLDELEEQSP